MKRIKKSLSLVMALITVITAFFCLTVSASAAVKTIKNNTYVSLTTEGTYYKLTVSGEGYITVSGIATKKGNYSSAYAYVDVLNSKKKEFCETDDDLYVSTYSGDTKASIVVPVSKGTYYLYVDTLSRYDGATVKVKYKFTSIKQATNYCAAKAVTVAAGKTQKIYQTPLQNFDRWFKVTLTKNQKITISAGGYADFSLYNAAGDKFDLEYNNKTSKFVSPTLAKGTYYIILHPYYRTHNTAEYRTFSWK